MKVFILVLVCSITLCNVVYGDVAIGVKVAPAILYEQRGDSFYSGNTICDTEEAIGVYIKWLMDNGFLLRLDYDRHETGNTLQSSIVPIPYEEIEVTQEDMILYVGKEWDAGVYILLGVGLVKNTLYIEGYVANPFSYSSKNSLGQAIVIGYNTDIYKKWRVFVEGRYLWCDMEVDLDYRMAPQANFSITEDMDNFGVFLGLEYRF